MTDWHQMLGSWFTRVSPASMGAILVVARMSGNGAALGPGWGSSPATYPQEVPNFERVQAILRGPTAA